MSDPEYREEALRWLRFAREDLAEAERLLRFPDAVPRHICWLAQQAAEKALKAALILEGVEFPYRHDLDALRNLLPDGWAVKVEHPDFGRAHGMCGGSPVSGRLARGHPGGRPAGGGPGAGCPGLHCPGLQTAEHRGELDIAGGRPWP